MRRLPDHTVYGRSCNRRIPYNRFVQRDDEYYMISRCVDKAAGVYAKIHRIPLVYIGIPALYPRGDVGYTKSDIVPHYVGCAATPCASSRSIEIPSAVNGEIP